MDMSFPKQCSFYIVGCRVAIYQNREEVKMQFSNRQHIEYIGVEDNFAEFARLMNDRLERKGSKAVIWSDISIRHLKIDRRIYPNLLPVYFRRYNDSPVSLKKLLLKADIAGIVLELVNRHQDGRYKKLREKDCICLCCLRKNKGNPEVIENIKEEDFRGFDNVVVLRRPQLYCGMFSHQFVMLPYLMWADKNNLSVYFDMENGSSVYREKDGENAWEYFYDQLDGKPDGNNGTIVSCLFGLSSNYNLDIGEDAIEYAEWSRIYNKYIKLNRRMRFVVEENWERIRRAGGSKERILGIKFRGADYKPDKLPKGHYIQLSCDEMINRARLFMERHGYKYIYLSTEEQESLDRFREEFGEEFVLSYDCKLVENYIDGAAAVNQAETVGRRKAGEDYIGTIMCLARCDSLLCSLNSGSIIALIINGGKFEHIEIVDRGVR